MTFLSDYLTVNFDLICHAADLSLEDILYWMLANEESEIPPAFLVKIDIIARFHQFLLVSICARA